jgi:hypothetical protein
MATPYRTPAPQPPKPRLPFSERHPTLVTNMKRLATAGAGLGGLAAILGVLWLLGAGFRLTGFIPPNDLAPNILGGLLMVMFAILAAMIGFGTYMLGRLIMSKITGEDSPW